MKLGANKTKIVATIGPASESPEMMMQLILAGMNIARLNFSHGDFSRHGTVIENLRQAEETVGREISIMADLPGPKMRIGMLAQEPIELKPGRKFILSTEEFVGDINRVSVTFKELPHVVKNGDKLFLNDGLIHLLVEDVQGEDVHCRVLVGGELRSKKGLNLPNIKLGISAFTEHDKKCIAYALEHGVDAVSQSFVENAADVHAVRDYAKSLGYTPFIIAKIERTEALANIDEILDAADGIMIARGDLGVEVPLERIAILQKQIMQKTLGLGKPVITATQMLESMVENRQPTRAEATDVANAIIDGTDCVMLSAESAMGRYPVEAVMMLASIASAVEAHAFTKCRTEFLEADQGTKTNLTYMVSLNVANTLAHSSPAIVIVPTVSGYAARMVSRFRSPVWTVAVSPKKSTCKGLQFSYGVFPVHQEEYPDDWSPFAREWLARYGIPGDLVLVTEGPSPWSPEENNRLEMIDLTR